LGPAVRFPQQIDSDLFHAFFTLFDRHQWRPFTLLFAPLRNNGCV
jgi:hypothetical protein